MIAVGIDSVEIHRIQKSVGNPRFCRRVFGNSEYSQLALRGFSPSSAAASFSAKEAFAKVLGTGVRGFSLSEVELLRDEWGAPYLKLSGAAAQMAEEKGFMRFSVSVTHTKQTATVIVIGERKTEK